MESSKRAGEELEQESIKKQKVDKDKETAELQRLIKIVSDEEVAIDVIPLATKPPSIERFGNLVEIDQVWRNQQVYRVLDWKIYDSCGVHSLRMQHMQIHMLVEKRYPLTPATITDMLNKKLHLFDIHSTVTVIQLPQRIQINHQSLLQNSYGITDSPTAALTSLKKMAQPGHKCAKEDGNSDVAMEDLELQDVGYLIRIQDMTGPRLL
ncbi:hypothetical protein Tco_1002904 [Tanacetum coccineum]|uniref:Uncharacterized protein n=1 Tax=Tanacetum coccineum TaxID=301880 RepID=A0ABQ5F7K2_9ASTR